MPVEVWLWRVWIEQRVGFGLGAISKGGCGAAVAAVWAHVGGACNCRCHAEGSGGELLGMVGFGFDTENCGVDVP